MPTTSEPARPVTTAEVESYQRDGAVLLRGIMPMAWVEVVRQGIEEVRSEPGRGETFGDADEFFLANMNGPRNDKIWRYVTESPLAPVCAAVHQAAQLQYFLDQIFFKAAGRVPPTEWHQDTPYFDVTGRDIVRAWLPCDAAPRQITVEVLRGSQSSVTYRTKEVVGMAVAGSGDGTFRVADLVGDTSAPTVPDIDADRGAYDILGWDVEPGDLLVFHGHVLHAAGGAADHPRPRRALAVVFAGEQERFVTRPGRSIPDFSTVSGVRLADGDLLSDFPDAYPVVWTGSG